MKSFETPAGKTIQLSIKENSSHIKISFGQGGELPEELTGVFTSEVEAEKAVICYLDKVKDKKPTLKK